ncbi:hypothetical protein [Pseudomonas sp. BGI-2]|uniref:hypothetical protein n=1 Tax=Pseudomonas sp. BGI-2 TaxID=2528211 RepID=UPI0010332060|nr:hypothetical protein [Pseudomonas sp. BGI-2]TBN34964.1 hypothetical protein EYC95_26435 [Pseudomonas sp. BGI-2]
MATKWKWNDVRDTASFSTRLGAPFKVQFFAAPAIASPAGVDTWSVSFSDGENSVDATGNGSAHEIYDTIQAIVAEVIQRQPYRGICFSAEADHSGRVRLNARLAKNLALKFQMEVQEVTRDDLGQVVHWLSPK